MPGTVLTRLAADCNLMAFQVFPAERRRRRQTNDSKATRKSMASESRSGIGSSRRIPRRAAGRALQCRSPVAECPRLADWTLHVRTAWIHSTSLHATVPPVRSGTKASPPRSISGGTRQACFTRGNGAPDRIDSNRLVAIFGAAPRSRFARTSKTLTRFVEQCSILM